MHVYHKRCCTDLKHNSIENNGMKSVYVNSDDVVWICQVTQVQYDYVVAHLRQHRNNSTESFRQVQCHMSYTTSK